MNSAQPMKVQVYSLNTNDGKHLESDMETLLDVEVSRIGVTLIGNGAKKWLEQNVEVVDDSEHPSMVSYHSTTTMELEEEAQV